MKILLLGKNGQLGWELQRSLSVLGRLIASDRCEHQSLCGDLTQLSKLRQTIQLIKPDIIVNAAAYTAVDAAESDKDKAFLINHLAPKLIAEEAQKLNALFIHYSTDYVFNGEGKAPWYESDKTDPLNIYGQSKLAGEQAIIASNCRHLIFRTSWVYAAKGNNFAKTMLKLAKDKTELSIISDQVGAPTSTELLADTTAQVITKSKHLTDYCGTYHVAASGETTWFDYANFVFKVAAEKGVNLSLTNVKPITTSEYPTPAARPFNSRLNTQKLCNTFSLTLPSWKQGVERMLTEIIIKE